MKKVLLTTHHEAFLHPRGAEVEMNSIYKFLKNRNVDSTIYSYLKLSEKEFDIVLHFSTKATGYDLLLQLKKLKKKIILYPNIWFQEDLPQSDLENIKRFFELADIIIFKSNSELEIINSKIDLQTEKTKVIFPFVNKKFSTQINSEIFKSAYSLKKYILNIGVIEKNKNQLEIIKAFNFDYPKGYKLVFIGQPVDENYFKECKNVSNENVLFIPQMKSASDILVGAINGCDLFVEISNEPAGLSALEAAYSNRKTLLRDSSWSKEFFSKDNDNLISLDINEIAKKINFKLNNNNMIKDKIYQNIKSKTNENNILELIKCIDKLRC